MQNIKNILIKVSVALSMAIVSAGCISEKEAMPESLQSVMVQVNVAVGQMTKAETEAPSDMEREIKSIRIFAFQNNRLAGHYFRAEASDSPILIDLQVPKSGSANVDFYAIANESAMRMTASSAQISERMTKAQLEALAFDAIYSIGQYGLPMYARKTNHNISFEEVSTETITLPGHAGHIKLIDKVDLSLTRPLAKISMFAAKKEASSNLVISDVTMLAGGTRQYAYLYDQADASKIESIGPRANDRNLFSGSQSVESFLASEAEIENASSYEAIFTDAYIPEVPFAGGDPKSVILNVSYSGGYGSVAITGSVNMPAIERNVHYKVYCSFAANGKMSVDFVVADWEDAQMWEGGLVFDYPTHSYLLPSATSTNHSSDPAEMSYVEGEDSGAFIGYFQMAYPANQTWTPTIFDGIADRCTVEVWNSDGTEKIEDSAEWVSGSEWYMIKVIPNEASASGGKVKLAITYRPIWSDQAEFLMINGTQSDPVWPYTSTDDIFKSDPNYVVITQK